MSQLGEAFRNHHRSLLRRLEQYSAAVQGPDADQQAARLVSFLQEELLPHARGEERHLYPAVEPLLHRHGQATATMSVDHEALEGYVQQLTRAAEALRRAPPDRRADVEQRLQRLLVELSAVLRLHTEKEERVYLPLVEQHLPEQEQRRLLEAMHDGEGGAAHQGGHGPAHGLRSDGGPSPEPPSGGPVLDVRALAPPRRHPLIFQVFDQLGPGQALELINDHDPRALYYQFAAERPGQFTWQYLQQGPEVWRVRIGRAPSAPAMPGAADRPDSPASPRRPAGGPTPWGQEG